MHEHKINGGRSPKKTLSLTGKSNQKSVSKLPEQLKTKSITVNLAVHISDQTLKIFQFENDTTATYIKHEITVNPKQIAKNESEYSILGSKLKKVFRSKLEVDYSNSIEETLSKAESKYFEILQNELDLVTKFRGPIQFDYCNNLCNAYLSVEELLNDSINSYFQKLFEAIPDVTERVRTVNVYKLLDIVFTPDFWKERNIETPPYDIKLQSLNNDALIFYQANVNASIRFGGEDNPEDIQDDEYSSLTLGIKKTILGKIAGMNNSLIMHNPDYELPIDFSDKYTEILKLSDEKDRKIKEKNDKLFTEKALVLADYLNSEHLKECIDQGFNCKALYHSLRFEYIEKLINEQVLMPLEKEYEGKYSFKLEYYNSQSNTDLGHGKDVMYEKKAIPSLMALKVRKGVMQILNDNALVEKLYMESIDTVFERLKKNDHGVHFDETWFGTIYQTSSEMGVSNSDLIEYVDFDLHFIHPVTSDKNGIWITIKDVDGFIDSLGLKGEGK